MNRTNRNLLAVATLTLAPLAAAFAVEPPQRSDTISVTSRSLPAETTYVTALHTQLDHQKRYPSGREASIVHPSGASTVWVEVDRDGRIVARGVDATSYSTLLDTTALALVGRTAYGAFPADAWSDASTHRFRVTYRFDPQATSADEQVAVSTVAE
jgi:periplasmic protein TonB